MEPIRTFIAVPVPADVRADLAECAQRMAPAFAASAARWVSPDGIHLTLRFLGATDPGMVGGLGNALRQIAGSQPPFALRLAGTGAFPNVRRPRVVWVGIEDPHQLLAGLQRQVESLARGAGWQPERRPFTPHLTLGRVREGGSPLVGDWLAQVAPRPVPVSRLELVESRLGPDGAAYRTLEAAALGGS